MSVLGIVVGILFIMEFALPDTLAIVAPLLSFGWAVWLAVILWRETPALRYTHAPEA
jgi:hypothetical protein